MNKRGVRRITVDDRGIWRADSPAQSYGINWPEISKISAYKLDGITEAYTIVTFDFDFGEYFEVSEDDIGFEGLYSALPRHLPGLRDDWHLALGNLAAGHEAVTVWSRS